MSKKTLDQKVYESLSGALFDSDLVATRLALSFAEMCWAVMLLWPGDTFDRPTYGLRSEIASETAWSAIFLLTSFLQFSIVIQADFHGKFARYFAAWNAALWVFTVVSMVLSVYPPPAAIGGEMALMLSATWIWLRPFIIAEGLQRVHG